MAPRVAAAARAADTLYVRLPVQTVQAIAGLALCLFGRRYALLITALEAFRAVGWGRVAPPLRVLRADCAAVAAQCGGRP